MAIIDCDAHVEESDETWSSVACAVDEDLSHIIDKVGVGFLITQTNFPHGDEFWEDHLSEILAERGDVSDADIARILSDNPLRFYHL